VSWRQSRRRAEVESALKRGIELAEQAQYEDAVAQFREVIRLQPDNPAAHFDVAVTLIRLGKLDEAIPECREAIRIQPNYAEAHAQLGGALRSQGKVDEAIAEYREAIRLKPENAKVHYNLAEALRIRRKIDEAIAEDRAAIQLEPGFAEAHFELGTDLHLQRKLAEAVPEYREAIKLKPDFLEAHLNAGAALRDQGKLAEAIPEYREVVRIQPGNVLVRATLALDLLMSSRSRSDHDEALEHARKAFELAPRQGMFARVLSLAEYRTGHWAEAIVAAERSMGLQNGGDAHDWFVLAMVYWQKGDKDQARRWFDRAVAWTKQNAPKSPILRDLWTESAALLGRPGPGADPPAAAAPAPAAVKPR
jgi:tetratricopeptide (TPR) repeat protein